jgi:hypothetical protein
MEKRVLFVEKHSMLEEKRVLCFCFMCAVCSGILVYGFGIIHPRWNVQYPLEMKISLATYQSPMLRDGEELECLYRDYCELVSEHNDGL